MNDQKIIQNRILSVEAVSRIMATARISKNKSQKFMAKSIGKSLGTIQNWESGMAVPNLIDFVTWFDILGINPMRYILEFIHPEIFERISSKNSDDEIRSALIKYIENEASVSEIRKLSYCIFGNTGSSWMSQLDMLCAHNHTPLKYRIGIASAVASNYEIAGILGELEGTDHILADMKNLNNAIALAVQSVRENKNGYTNI